MLCEKCRQREATVHKQVIINGVSPVSYTHLTLPTKLEV